MINKKIDYLSVIESYSVDFSQLSDEPLMRDCHNGSTGFVQAMKMGSGHIRIMISSRHDGIDGKYALSTMYVSLTIRQTNDLITLLKENMNLKKNQI